MHPSRLGTLEFLHQLKMQAKQNANSRRPFVATFTESEQKLYESLTTEQELPCSYNGKPYGELFIHWFYVTRDKPCLTKCEIFHLNMLRYFAVPRKMSIIHIRLAYNGGYVPTPVESFVSILESYGCKVNLKVVKQKDNWEHDTIKEAAEYAVSTGKYIYYIHFKGVSRINESFTYRTGRERVHPLNVLYWCYLLYRGLFDEYPMYPAVGPIACNRINKEYVLRDLSWSTNPKYQYIGSFQAFNGKALSNAFDRLNLDRPTREKVVWWGGRYTVEMFLTLVFLENEVRSIAQMENETSAYRMYTNNFFPDLRNEFLSLFGDGQYSASKRNNVGKVAICAIARNEELYIEEWVEYYKKNGISHIYLFDNNDGPSDIISKISKDPFITVIPVYGEKALHDIGYQCGVYGKAYREYGHLYEWMGFFDIDEFVVIDNTDIPGFLSNPLYKDSHVVHLHWRYYGDNGLTHYAPEPVMTRFVNPAPVDVKYSNLKTEENRYVKSFIRTGYPDFQSDVHSPRFFGSVCRNSKGYFELPNKSISDIVLDNARVNHYGTKTIEEYILRRMPNKDKMVSPNGACPERKTISAKDRLDWFFNVNEITDEKLSIVREMLPKFEYKPQK